MRPNEDTDRAPCSRSDSNEIGLAWRDGRELSVSASGDETVLDAAARAGASLPFGCLTGACATCTGRVLDGRVEHRRPPRALQPRHAADGYALLCVAEPRSDCRIEVGVDVRTDLVSNPWR